MPVTFTTKNNLVLAIIAAALILIIGCCFYLFSQLLSANWWVEHTLEVMAEADNSLICMMDCETACRGFLITNDERYLKPYEHCYKEVAQHINRIQTLTKDNAAQQALTPVLLRLAQDKIANTQLVIAARRAATGDEAERNIASLEPGKKTMDEFRHIVAKILDNEKVLLQKRLATAKQLEQIVYLVIALLAGATLGLILWLFLTAKTYFRKEVIVKEELNRAFDEVVQSRAEAVRASDLKSQFVANISHEIRTPLSGIIGLSELMVTTESAPDPEMAKHILDSAKTLLKVINDLLDFSKLESGHVKIYHSRFRFNDLVDSVLNSARLASTQKHIRLEKKIDPLLPDSVIGDEKKLHQILLNLTYNALKFTESGSVTVEVSENRKSDEQIFVRFAVIDTGEGIEPKTLDKLFQPFVQGDGKTNQIHGGTGLGLSISKKLVELLGGELACDSQVGKGSTFRFVIPVTETKEAS